MESVGSEYQGRVTVVAVDASDDPETARALGAFAVPLLVALLDGRERARRVGAATASDVRAVYAAALGEGPVPTADLPPAERFLRALAGLGLVAVGLASGPRWLLVGLGGALLALAVLSGRRFRRGSP